MHVFFTYNNHLWSQQPGQNLPEKKNPSTPDNRAPQYLKEN